MRGQTRLAAAQSLPSAFHVEPSVRGPELESFLLGVEGAQSNGNSGSPDGSTSSPSSSSAKFEQVYAEQASPLLPTMTKRPGKTGEVQSITPFLSESPSFFKEAARYCRWDRMLGGAQRERETQGTSSLRILGTDTLAVLVLAGSSLTTSSGGAAHSGERRR